MNTKAIGWKLGRVVSPVLVVAVGLAFTAAASAQTFQANVYEKSQKQNLVSCPTQYYCGNATIAGYGPAFWYFSVPDGPQPVTSNCARYVGTSTFTLVNDPTSVLVLSENEYACTPGSSGTTPEFWQHAFGHPLYSSGTWQFVSGTGQFSGLSTGSGTDTLRSDGAILEAALSGTVTQ